MGSHSFSFYFPELISGIILNTGMMDIEYSEANKKDYTRAKLAVFLASPTDSRYKEMHRDQAFLKELGWKTLWIEFKGGHILAPQDVYLQAAQWIATQWDNY